MSAARRAGRGLLWPVRRLLDPRFDDVNRRLATSSQQTQGALDALAKHVNDIVGGYTESQLEAATFVGAQLRELESAVQDLRAENEALREEIVARAVQDLRAENEALRAEIVARFDPERSPAVRARLEQLAGGRIEDLDQPAADVLNYASSHRGYAAQAELWLNPPLVLEHGEHEVRLANVNERIVEIPFAMSLIGRLAPGARVLDVGSSESSLALSLASLGYRTTALDLRTYPFAHPLLEVVASPIEEWVAPPESYDAALCVSTLEHVGLGWYGDPEHDGGGDRRALDIIAARLVPGGMLVLTVPYGTASVDALQRRYDRAALDALLSGWEILERRIVEQADERVWQPVQETSADAVALVLARKPASV